LQGWYKVNQSRKDILRPSNIGLVAANLLPLAGVLFWRWNAFYVVLLYWAENLIVGFYAILKMFFAKAEHPIERLFRIFPAAFFVLHYGGFCGGHGLFILFLFGNKELNLFPGNNAWPCILVFLQLLINVIRQLFTVMPWDMLLILTGLFLSHGVGFVNNYLLNGEYLTAKTQKLMHEPYPRIVVLHIAIILGAFLTTALGSPIGLLVALVILKTAFELSWQLKHQQKIQISKKA